MIKGKANEKENALGWKLNNSRWLPKSCAIRGYAPSFQTVENRGNAEYQRNKKLEAEDILLRDILLEKDERDSSAFFDGDVSVV